MFKSAKGLTGANHIQSARDITMCYNLTVP